MGLGGGLNRRSFLIAASATGGGLALGFAVPLGPQHAAGSAPAAEAPEITCWLTIARDDTVTIRVAHSEMGQGALTGLAMLVAEELECDWAKVRAQFVSPSENARRQNAWGDTSTGASRSICLLAALPAAGRRHRPRHADHRRGGALERAGRAMPWRATASSPMSPTGRTLSYGAVAEDGRQGRAVDRYQAEAAGPVEARRHAEEAARCPRQGHRPAGLCHRCPAPRTCSTPRIVHCPVFKGTPKSIDESSIAGMKGVRTVVRMDDAVAVIADSWWRAKRAADALKVTWDDRGNGALSSPGDCEAGARRTR